MKCKNCVRHAHLNDYGERTVGTPNWCFYLSDSPDEELERDCKAFKCSTNADRIRAMTDEELAEFLLNRDLDVVEKASKAVGFTYKVDREPCLFNVIDWLKEEATQNDS